MEWLFVTRSFLSLNVLCYICMFRKVRFIKKGYEKTKSLSNVPLQRTAT